MQVVMEHEKAQGRQVYDVHEKNLGYDITSLDLISGELRLIEVKGLGDATGTILLTPNERRVAEDRRDCYWLYVVTNCGVAQASSLHGVAQTSTLRTGWHGRGYLPHLKAEGGTYFVTFRLADTLPKSVLEQIEQERDALERRWLTERGALTETETKRLDNLRSERIETYLDNGAGSCWLGDPAVASVVLQALRHFDGERYILHAAVVMPNHVHALLTPLGAHTLSEILHSWKSFTATEANRILQREGQAFWQRESYDHLIRDAGDYSTHYRYILENPSKAGLGDWPYVYAALGGYRYARQEDAGRMPALHTIRDPARFPWHEVKKVQHYWLDVNAMTQPMQVREDSPGYGTHRRGAENADGSGK